MVCREKQLKAYILHLKAYKIDLPKFQVPKSRIPLKKEQIPQKKEYSSFLFLDSRKIETILIPTFLNLSK